MICVPRSRATTFSARLPKLRKSFTAAPVSNADVGMTIAKILGLRLPSKGTLVGRAFSEAMPGGKVPAYTRGMRLSAQTATGLVTMLKFQQVGSVRYIDAAGFPSRTVGLGGDAHR